MEKNEINIPRLVNVIIVKNEKKLYVHFFVNFCGLAHLKKHLFTLTAKKLKYSMHRSLGQKLATLSSHGNLSPFLSLETAVA